MITLGLASTELHFRQILELQRRNLARALSPEEEGRWGFVFVKHIVPLLRRALPAIEPMFEQFGRGGPRALRDGDRRTQPGLGSCTPESRVRGDRCVLRWARGVGNRGVAAAPSGKASAAGPIDALRRERIGAPAEPEAGPRTARGHAPLMSRNVKRVEAMRWSVTDSGIAPRRAGAMTASLSSRRAREWI